MNGKFDTGGIVFFGTKKLKELTEFYHKKISCRIWLEQADCTIFSHGSFLFGFCQRASVETDGIITFFFDTKEKVDQFYAIFHELAESPPKMNDKYNIYHFFIRDPEGRKVEFQHFINPVDLPL